MTAKILQFPSRRPPEPVKPDNIVPLPWAGPLKKLPPPKRVAEPAPKTTVSEDR